MQEIIREILNQDFDKIVLSDKRNNDYIKAFIRKVVIKNQLMFQLELFSVKQAFHHNHDIDEMESSLMKLLQDNFRQLNVDTTNYRYQIKISKKNKVLTSKKKIDNQVNCDYQHNKNKKYLLDDYRCQVLKELDIIDDSNNVKKNKEEKYKQINGFLEVIVDVIKGEKKKDLRIVDFGCGKSYLTFIIYDYLTNYLGYNIQMIGLDLKEEVINLCNDLANKYNYQNLHFITKNIKDYTDDQPIDMVITLHACDVATDYALYNAISWNCKYILSVPCCQHELYSMITSPYSSILDYGIIKERISALYTDTLRGKLLECMGYDVSLVEFVDMNHSLKNIMIKAKYTNNKLDYNLLKPFIKDFNLNITLLKLLRENNYVKD
ncbi:MAG: SAM-dependent methyltransferase [Erysipelotrichaceae bacterium]